MLKFNLKLILKIWFQTLRTIIPDVKVKYVYPLSEKPIYLFKQNKFATNFLHFQLLVTWHVTWLKLNVKAQEDLKIYFWGNIHFVLA